MKKKIQITSLFISRGKLIYAIVCRPRLSFQEYFNVKFCFFEWKPIFFFKLSISTKQTEQLSQELFFYTTSNNKQNIKSIMSQKKNLNNYF